MTISQTIDSLSLIGKSDSMQQVYKVIGRVCNIDSAILLLGEKGSGKGIVAQALHYFSHRASYPFNVIPAAEVRELPDEILLGIDETHPSESTCYITDWTSIPVFAHHQILTIHKTKQFRCSHENQRKSHNFRFIVSTDRDLKSELESGRIPLDVFYDWNFLPIYIPPLRDRKEDIALYANHFLENAAAAQKISSKELSPEAVEILNQHEWPGNLTELKMVMTAALANCKGNYIRAEHLPELGKRNVGDTGAFQRLEQFLSSRLTSYIQGSQPTSKGNLYRLLLPHIEKSLFDFVLKKSKGNKNKASEILGLHRNTLNKKLQKLDRL